MGVVIVALLAVGSVWLWLTAGRESTDDARSMRTSRPSRLALEARSCGLRSSTINRSTPAPFWSNGSARLSGRAIAAKPGPSWRMLKPMRLPPEANGSDRVYDYHKQRDNCARIGGGLARGGGRSRTARLDAHALAASASEPGQRANAGERDEGRLGTSSDCAGSSPRTKCPSNDARETTAQPRTFSAHRRSCESPDRRG